MESTDYEALRHVTISFLLLHSLYWSNTYQNYHKFALLHLVRAPNTKSTHKRLTEYVITPQKTEALFLSIPGLYVIPNIACLLYPQMVFFVIGVPVDEQEHLSVVTPRKRLIIDTLRATFDVIMLLLDDFIVAVPITVMQRFVACFIQAAVFV
jgi:hypothetical protein